MANTMRYRSGVMECVSLPTANDGDTTHSIEVGDLVYVSGGKAYPASAMADQSSLTANQAAFALAFAGVAVEKTGLQTGEKTFHLTDDPGSVYVAVTGDFEFPCDATSFATGDRIGAAENSDGNALEDQKVAQVASNAYTIGVAKVPYNAIGTSQTSIIMSIRSQLIRNEVVSGV